MPGPSRKSTTSGSGLVGQSLELIAEDRERLPHLGGQSFALDEILSQLRDEFLHPLLESPFDFLDVGSSDVATRREREPGPLDLIKRRRAAEAGLVRVAAYLGLSAPSAVSVG